MSWWLIVVLGLGWVVSTMSSVQNERWGMVAVSFLLAPAAALHGYWLIFRSLAPR